MVAPGTVILVPFPFSDLSQAKLRPAVVLADSGRGDLILCQITSNAYSDARVVRIADADFHSGSLRLESFARPGKLFTGNERLIVQRAGVLHPLVFDAIVDAVISLIAPKGRV